MTQTKFDGSAKLAGYGPFTINPATKKFTAWYPANCVSILQFNANN